MFSYSKLKFTLYVSLAFEQTKNIAVSMFKSFIVSKNALDLFTELPHYKVHAYER